MRREEGGMGNEEWEDWLFVLGTEICAAWSGVDQTDAASSSARKLPRIQKR
jgi:hypothetical protein